MLRANRVMSRLLVVVKGRSRKYQFIVFSGLFEIYPFENRVLTFHLLCRTIALLLAIGEMLETPFRVMDEFDVFLDPVTRKTVIDTLVEIGNDMKHRQFIFITPQDVSHLDSTPTLKILQMKPPERRTVAGGHEQQTLSFSSSQQ